jgi:transcriptional repressor NF-X1
MTCGFHQCGRHCHGDVCGPCTAPCGKSRKLWYVGSSFSVYAVIGLIWFLFDSLPAQHACTQTCHAPSICPENEPCQSLLTLTCSCGRIRQAVQCGRNSSNTTGAQRAIPKCNNDCSLAQRNAKLADALGIIQGEKVSAITYHEDLITFAKADNKFLGLVEKAFAEYVFSRISGDLLDRYAFVTLDL